MTVQMLFTPGETDPNPRCSVTVRQCTPLPSRLSPTWAHNKRQANRPTTFLRWVGVECPADVQVPYQAEW